MRLMVCFREGLRQYSPRLAAPGHRCTVVGLCGAVVASACYFVHRYSSSRATASSEKCTPGVPPIQLTASNTDLLPADAEGQEDAGLDVQALQAARESAATTIQQAYRRNVGLRLRKEAVVQAAMIVQALVRGQQARKQYTTMCRQRAAVVIQAHWRGCVLKSRFQALRSAAIVIQDAVRARQAAAELCCLKARHAAAQSQAAAAPSTGQGDDGGRRRYSLEFLTRLRPVNLHKPAELPDGLWINNPNELAAQEADSDQAVEQAASRGAGMHRRGSERPQHDGSRGFIWHGRDTHVAAGGQSRGRRQTGQRAGGTGNDMWARGCPLPPARGCGVMTQDVKGTAVANLPALHHAQSAYKARGMQEQTGLTGPADAQEEEEAKQKHFMSILNRLTPDAFEKLSKQLLDVEILEARTLMGLTGRVHAKALADPHFSELYSQLCTVLHGNLPEFEDPESVSGGKLTFRRLLLDNCQKEHSKGDAAMTSANETVAQQQELKAQQQRARARANIQFVGHLYGYGLLPGNIVCRCVQQLLQKDQHPRAEDVECLCKLLSTVGQRLETELLEDKAGMHSNQLVQLSADADAVSGNLMEGWFDVIKRLSEGGQLESRLRFLLWDLVEQRQNGWVARMKHNGPKHIKEIHEEAQQEAAQVALRDRRDGRMPGTRSGRANGAFAGGSGDKARNAGPGGWRPNEMPHGPASRSSRTDRCGSMGTSHSPVCGATGTSGHAAATARDGSRLREEVMQHPSPTRREDLILTVSDPAGLGWPDSGEAVAGPDAFGYYDLAAGAKDHDVLATAADLAGFGGWPALPRSVTGQAASSGNPDSFGYDDLAAAAPKPPQLARGLLLLAAATSAAGGPGLSCALRRNMLLPAAAASLGRSEGGLDGMSFRHCCRCAFLADAEIGLREAWYTK